MRRLSKNAQANVVKGGAEHGAGALDVQSPATIFILMVVDVTQDFLAMLRLSWEDSVKMASYVQAHYQGWQEK